MSTVSSTPANDVVQTGVPPLSPIAGSSLSRKSGSRLADRVYMALLFLASLTILAIVVGLAVQLIGSSMPSLKAFKFHFFVGDDWDPVADVYAARPFILGTLYSSTIALMLSVPISIGTAIFLAEICPKWLRTPLSFMVELLAAVPSVVYGLWAIMVMIPWLTNHVETPISKNRFLSHTALFNMPPNGQDMLAAGLILAIMITPYITAVSRDILRAIPKSVREGSYALGSTKWEAIKLVVLPFARAGIIGAVILGLGRALGETMAVTMVIGNGMGPFTVSLFGAGSTMASVIANDLGDASGLHISALIEIGMVLFLVTMTVNAVARLLIFFTAKDLQGGGRRL
jgi:phosphate transport system permease protein